MQIPICRSFDPRYLTLSTWLCLGACSPASGDADAREPVAEDLPRPPLTPAQGPVLVTLETRDGRIQVLGGGERTFVVQRASETAPSRALTLDQFRRDHPELHEQYLRSLAGETAEGLQADMDLRAPPPAIVGDL